MPYFGNQEISIEAILKLGEWFELKATKDDELFVRPKKDSYTKDEVRELLAYCVDLRPDECDEVEDGWIRLWWD